MTVDVTELVLRGLDADVRARHGAVLADRLREGLAAAREKWPDGPEPGEAFAAWVVERVAKQTDLAAAAPRLRGDDLYLAWWACTRDDAGIAAFEAAYASDIARLVQRFHRLQPEELRQALRIKLFVGSETSPPRLRDYAGFGFLQNWLKVTAARSFLDIARAERGRRIEAELDDEMLEVAVMGAAGGDPREQHQSAQVNAAVKRAFAAAVAALVPRERTFLRHAMVDHLTLEQIAATYKVHRTTVARTLASARARLLEETRAGVVAELGIAAERIDSAIQALDSRIDLSLSRVLRDPGT